MNAIMNAIVKKVRVEEASLGFRLRFGGSYIPDGWLNRVGVSFPRGCSHYLVRYSLDEAGGLRVMKMGERLGVAALDDFPFHLARFYFLPVCFLPREWVGKRVRREVLILS